jgi:serine/threonine protein kinase
VLANRGAKVSIAVCRVREVTDRYPKAPSMNAESYERALWALSEAAIIDNTTKLHFLEKVRASEVADTSSLIAMITVHTGSELRFERFFILDLFTRGGEGQVYRAREEHTERPVALKVTSVEATDDWMRIKDRFKRAVLHRKSHPNVVELLSAGVTNDKYFWVMELLDGPDLYQLVRRNRAPLDTPVACEYIRQAALGLQHLHEQHIYHRDIKPDNLILAAGGTLLKVADLGFAHYHMIDDNGDECTRLTPTRMTMGTFPYVAPELQGNAKGANAQSDIWSLGGTLYYLLTLEPPPPDPEFKLLPKNIDPTVRAILDRMTKPTPGDRFPAARDVASALEPFCNGVRPRTTPTDHSPATFQIRPGGKALAVGAHWDDIFLGCLGTLLRLKNVHRYEVAILILCNDYKDDHGEVKYYGVAQPGMDSSLIATVDRLNSLGIRTNVLPLSHQRIRDGRFSYERSALNRYIEQIAKDHRDWDLIFTPAEDDNHVDHALTGNLILSHFSKMLSPTILEYSVKDKYTNPGFIPNLLVDLGLPIPGDTRSVAQYMIDEFSGFLDAHFENAGSTFRSAAMTGRMKSNVTKCMSDRHSVVELGETFRTRVFA